MGAQCRKDISGNGRLGLGSYFYTLYTGCCCQNASSVRGAKSVLCWNKLFFYLQLDTETLRLEQVRASRTFCELISEGSLHYRSLSPGWLSWLWCVEARSYNLKDCYQYLISGQHMAIQSTPLPVEEITHDESVYKKLYTFSAPYLNHLHIKMLFHGL